MDNVPFVIKKYKRFSEIKDIQYCINVRKIEKCKEI